MITRQTDLTALRDELVELSTTWIAWNSCHCETCDTVRQHGRQLQPIAERLTDLLGSLQPQGKWPELRDNSKPNRWHEYADDPETGCCVVCGWSEHVHASDPDPALGSLPVPDTEEPVAYTILVEREEDRYFASWITGDGKEGGCANYSSTVVGALAELCSTLLKVAEDKSHESRSPDGDGQRGVGSFPNVSHQSAARLDNREAGSEPADSLHQQIMNLPPAYTGDLNDDERKLYMFGHKDARHAAAELVAALLSRSAQEPPKAEAGKTRPTSPANGGLRCYCGVCDDCRDFDGWIEGPMRDRQDAAVSRSRAPQEGETPTPAFTQTVIRTAKPRPFSAAELADLECPSCEALRAALALQAQPWQPMETALKDGTPILIDFSRHGVHRVFWSEEPFSVGIGAWCVTDLKYEDRPLRRYIDDDMRGWMPLPAPQTASLPSAAAPVKEHSK